jgi:magnesium transporter
MEQVAGNGRDDQTVARYTVTAVPTAGPHERVGELRRHLAGTRYDYASHVFVLGADGELCGVIDMVGLFAASDDQSLKEVMKNDGYPVVAPATDREEAASTAIRSGVSTLAVCENGGRFIGAVPASALMSILRDEHLEDLHYMAGILARSKSARDALTAPPHRRAFYRMPWLLVGMAGSALATAMMVRFESALSADIAVAFFIPAIIYLADAVGTQSEAVAVRGLSLTGADLVPLLMGELGTGILIGATLGSLAFPLVWLAFGSMGLATTVAIALVVASSIATTIGLVLPWLFARFGYDPALGSGPVATVVQDVMSLLIYFLVAAAILN